MIRNRLENKSISTLLKDVMFITLIAIAFLVLVGKFGGYGSDYITKISCNAIDEKYIAGDTPGEGVCVRSTDYIDIKK